MALNLNALFKTMATAGETAFARSWGHVKDYTLPELKKIAGTFVDIEKGLMADPPYYTKESVAILLTMQMNASQAVITATTALTLIEVQKAFNQIMNAVKGTVNEALGFGLIV